MTMHLDITIGPVQGFVAQSRRTRDLWGSSYLLSFLSGHAMQGAQKAGGEIVRPVVQKDRLYQWIGGKRQGKPPEVGSLPNHFVVKVEHDKPAEVARAAEKALKEAWQKVYTAVWREFLAAPCRDSGSGTREIWDRQVQRFWEVAWTAGPDQKGGLLARRKHWRSHVPPDEPGDKCTVMHDLQELSGYICSLNSDQRKRQRCFWKHVGKGIGLLDIRDNERLCAIALVKRLFPKVAKKALGWDVDRSRWPSTVHMGARPWIRQVLDTKPDLAHQYAEAVKASAEQGAQVLSESQLPRDASDAATARDFQKLDANWFHREDIGNEKRCPLKQEDGHESVNALRKSLKGIYDSQDRRGHRLGPPSSFYALLLADGDRLGKLVSDIGGDKVGRALEAFTTAVPDIIRKHDGETVYAGGDDVLAMLPAPQALECAEALAKRYSSAFGDQAKGKPTLSAAVVFAHVRDPLSGVIAEAHRLLDDVAKEENGRNSLAVGLLKASSLNCQWVTTWERPGPDGSCRSSVARLRKLVGHLQEASEPGLSSALLYRIRQLLVKLGILESWRPGTWGSLPEDWEAEDAQALLRAEIAHSLTARKGETTDVQARAERMTDLVWRLLLRSPACNNEQDNGKARIGVDALFLARFLTQPDPMENAT